MHSKAARHVFTRLQSWVILTDYLDKYSVLVDGKKDSKYFQILKKCKWNKVLLKLSLILHSVISQITTKWLNLNSSLDTFSLKVIFLPWIHIEPYKEWQQNAWSSTANATTALRGERTALFLKEIFHPYLFNDAFFIKKFLPRKNGTDGGGEAVQNSGSSRRAVVGAR